MIEKRGTGILLAILLSTQAYALDPCMSGQFKIVDRQYTGMNLMFKPDGVVYGQWFSLIPVDGGIRADRRPDPDHSRRPGHSAEP